MKKKIGIIIFVVIVLIAIAIFIGRRIYYFTVIKNVYEAIENFRNEDNSYYAVTIKDSSIIKEEIVTKNNIVKWNEQKDGNGVYCQWKNFDNNQRYAIFLGDKTFKENDTLIFENNILNNLPQMIFFIYSKEYFNIKEFLKIKKISSSQYNNQDCYEIVTDTKSLIVSKENYLPIYYSVETINSEKNVKFLTETTYEFKVGEVTDEDIALPDLTGYTQISGE